MVIHWKASAVAASAAAVLVILIAALAGVPIGTIIIRALVGAVVFGAGTAGAILLIDRYLPELTNQDETQDAQSETGKNVDILVEDEAESDEDLRPPDADEELIEEVEEEPAHHDDSEEQGEPPTAEEDIEDIEGQDLDKLPDLGGFAESFESERSSSGSSGAGSTSSMRSSSSDVDTGDHSAQEMAQALRTVLKREE
jgi:hypothetical protein